MQHGTIGRFVFATLLVALGTTPPAAAIDLSGDYVGFGADPFTVTDVQTGTTLQMMGHVVDNFTTYPLSTTGTVDPATGKFSVAGEITGFCPDFAYSGTGDGEKMTGTFTSRSCGVSGTLILTKCGNGVIDPLEDCELGNVCCSARCRLLPAGTACTNDGNDCTHDVCDATGTCTHVPITGPCEDGNACTIGDVCAAGVCVPGSPARAGHACDDDFDPCTADVCDAAATCAHVPVPAGVCRRAACHSTCTQQLKECRQTCPGGGQARRDCRAACAQRSTCTAPGARIRTLAYVVNECSVDPQGMGSGLVQKLLIRRGNCDPVAVKEFRPTPGPDPLCRAYGEFRTGGAARVVGLFQHLFQRLAVLPDGSGVVFEVTSQFSASPAPTAELSPEDGIFFVRADGSGLRRLGPASRWPTFFVAADPPRGLTLGDYGELFPVSPDGRTVALIDLGPFDAAGHEAPQIFLLDLRSGRRCQLTHHSDSCICCESFLNSRTILFHGCDAAGLFTALSVKTDCKNPDEKELPSIALPGGGRVVSQFEVAGANPHALYVLFPDRPAVNGGFGGSVAEVFLLDGKKLVQLTNFRRDDTDQTGGFIARGRVLFGASANPLGENPDEICQLFSIDTFGVHLRQLTHLPWDGRPPTGCLVPANISRLFLDPITGTVLFQSSCDPVGANPFGEQLFAMRPDGTGLRQLTNARGLTIDPDGTVHVELPGPFAYTSRAGG